MKTCFVPFLSLWILTGPAFSAGAPEVKKEPPPFRLRFYCAEREVPMRYVTNAAGVVDVAPPAFEDVPPNVLYVDAKSEERKPIALLPGRVSAPIELPATVAKDGRIGIFAVRTTVVSAPRAAGEPPGAKDSLAETRTPFAELRVPPERPALVMFYQPAATGKWIPPRQLTLDIAKETVPDGACLLVNLSRSPVVALFGGKGAPASVPPGGSLVATRFTRDAAEHVLVRLAVPVGRDMKVLANGLQHLPAAGRTLLVVRSTGAASGAGAPAAYKLLALDD